MLARIEVQEEELISAPNTEPAIVRQEAQQLCSYITCEGRDSRSAPLDVDVMPRIMKGARCINDKAVFAAAFRQTHGSGIVHFELPALLPK